MSTELFAVLPRGWVMPPVYARFWVQLGKMLDEKRITGTHLAPYLRNVDVQWGHVNTVDLPEMDFSDEDRERYSLRKGDLLVCEGGEVGRTSIWDGALAECYFQKAIHRLRPTTQNDEPRFFHYFMWMAVHSGIFAQTTASTIQHLTAEKLRVVRYPSPPVQQQRAIADYLDRETARLDALVAAKERLLGLVAEKRRALITRAVTRGLAPHAPLRDSGIPWLGEIPAHWELSRLKHFAAIYYGLSQPPDYVPSGIPFLRATNVKRGELTKDGLVFVDEGDLSDSRVVRLCTGDIIVVRSGAYTGDSAIVTEEWRGAVAGYDMVVRIQQRAVPDFVSRALLCQYILEAQIDPLRLRAAQPHLNAEELGDISFALPPIDEQRAIVTHIAAETAKLDALRAATERTIALLRERRAALIAAAVTGRLDVQGAERHLDVVAD